MTLALIISPYNAPTAAERAANVRLGTALARWATAQGYTPVGWWCDVDPANPESDADPVVRAAALARSAERARAVGAAGGVAVAPGWIAPTSGMDADMRAWNKAAFYSPAETDIEAFAVSSADLAPYLLPEPVPTVPRAAVQAAVDRMDAEAIRAVADTQSANVHKGVYANGRLDAYQDAIDELRRHTGITPTEVQ